MRVVATDIFATESHVNFMIQGHGAIQVDIPLVSFDELIAQSDFISLHVPKQPDGSAVFGAAELAKTKKGAVLINSSRGGVIEESALLEALDSGHIRAACLDVFVGEPKPNPALLSHPNILSTPHIGASTLEAQERIGLEIAENVKRIVSAVKA
jgi:D-3-phosphoglycerate dehydrogenase